MRIDLKVLLPMSVRGVNKSRLLIDNGPIEVKICIPWVHLQRILEMLEGQIFTNRKIRNISSDNLSPLRGLVSHGPGYICLTHRCGLGLRISPYGITAEAQLKNQGEMKVSSVPLTSLKHCIGFILAALN